MKLKNIFREVLTNKSRVEFRERTGRVMDEKEERLLQTIVELQCTKRGPKITTAAAQFEFRLLDSIGYRLLKQSASLARKNGLVLVGANHLVAGLRHVHGDKKTLDCVSLLKL